jgi:DNA-directed RNA polymerase specialized sigma24 family protein
VESSVIATVAKYFFFTALDERVGFAASLKVLSELKANNWLDDRHRDRWIELLSRHKLRLRPRDMGEWSAPAGESAFSFSGEIDLSLWVSFQTSAPPEEVEAVLLSKLLGFTDEEIAAGLKVTVGTVRYRTGRGLRHLGGYLDS